MTEQHVEIEHKYDADPDFTVPDLSGLPGVASAPMPQRHLLHATYFDTEDLRLARGGITLRRRRGGKDAGWHLKMPAAEGKVEVHAPLGRAQTPPAKLAGLVAAHSRGAPLRPVATVETERTATMLLDAEGRMLAEVADDAVTGRDLRDGGTAVELAPGAPAETRAGAGDTARHWREIEVELGDAGSPDLLKAAGKRLKKAGATRSGAASKLARVLHAERDTARADAAARAGTAGEVVIAYIAARTEVLVGQDPRARQAGPDAVHQMRTSARRIRSALQNYKPLFDAERIKPVIGELKWLGEVLAEVRDLEVLRERFAGRLALLGDLAEPAWLAGVPHQERAAYRRLNKALSEPRYFALLDALDALVADPPFQGKAAGRKPAKELPGLIQKSWWRMERKYAAITGAEDGDVARHEARKAAKRARYAAELARPALGDAAKAAAKDAKRIQRVLGDHQDAVVAMERLRAAPARTPAEAFTLGVLYGAEHHEAETTRRLLESAWAAISTPEF
ncbi:CYTH and CHAD domain-containing protein [Actinomadura macrotermitis]|uniref:CHAD domain-containing protein n=1 Tax=Actinomadura macrotermitis TaxID=2585200 RepID=A0A7K0BUQ9_9ACTN|nr:CYTH and CHAD domain-containing protein [Actinomadura macrotermitis]MQY04877.1 hypothetical protein [Actinomadura macrotermitis]